jgi:energy-coupling factor transport system permease protein
MRLGIPEKLALALLVVTCSLALPWSASAVAVVVLLAARSVISDLRPLDKRSAKRFTTTFCAILLLVAVMISLNGILMRTGDLLASLGPLSVYEGGLLFGLTTGIRLLLIATVFLTVFGSTRIAEFADYLNRVGLPSAIVTTLLLALDFLDRLPGRVQQIFVAQESRGAPLRGNVIARVRSFFLLLSPLVLSSIVESVERGIALELRAFHAGIAPRLDGTRGSDRSLSTLSVVFLVLAALIALYGIISWLTPSP